MDRDRVYSGTDLRGGLHWVCGTKTLRAGFSKTERQNWLVLVGLGSKLVWMGWRQFDQRSEQLSSQRAAVEDGSGSLTNVSISFVFLCPSAHSAHLDFQNERLPLKTTSWFFSPK